MKCSSKYDFYEYIEKYEKLRNTPSCFEDYEAVKSDIIHLKEFTDTCSDEYTLIHNDLSCENCLFYKGENGEEKCILIDFEYAAMQCPAADIAYFCVFSDLNESEVDAIIKKYFEEEKDVWQDINLSKIEVYYFTKETKDRYFATRKPLMDLFATAINDNF